MVANSTNQPHHYDVLIIGSGAAGLSLAARLAPGLSIAILCKDQLIEGSSYYAQGGVAAVMDSNDSNESHIYDTQIAGAGLCEPDAIKFTVEHARESIEWLVSNGVPFDQIQLPDGSMTFHLTREGGHSHRRILHAQDRTGRAVTSTLMAIAKENHNITYYEYHNAVDLITDNTPDGNKQCLGAYVLNTKDNSIKTIKANITVLATGGASKVYLYSTNPDVSSGDGIAMAWRAGARVANMEFNQFHPTCLYHPKAKTFLISEALRGEGAKLKLPSGESFMHRFDEREELAPRDIVARAIDHEMKRLGLQFVHLDISHKSAAFIEKHFPTILDKCLAFDIDIRREPIPVVPAAHYTCGGVMTNLYGQTDVPNLYAVGEVAYTGLHGANRMASNSLLECLVYAASASKHISEHYQHFPVTKAIADWDESQVVNSDEEVVVSHNWNELRHFMWDYVGIVRSDKRLQRAKRRVDLLKQEIEEYYSSFRVTNDLLELRNLVLVAELIILSAMQRKESRGLHYTLDYPETDDAYLKKTVLTPTPYLTL